MSNINNHHIITDSKEFVKRMEKLRSQQVSTEAIVEFQHLSEVENSFDDLVLEDHFNKLANEESF